MKKWLIIFVAFTGFLLGSPPVFAATNLDEEQACIEVLQSDTASPRDKDAACARLKIIGSVRCVPALAALLTDDQLSHSARYALEPMQLPEAGRALLEALPKTKGSLRAGIVNSLGLREERLSVPALERLLNDPDLESSIASARALGRIGGPEAVTALRTCARNAVPSLHEAAVDSLLKCANRMLATGQRSMALAVFEQLDVPSEKESVRVAAFRGRVGASGNAGLNMVLHAISGPPGPSQIAALQLARGLSVPHITRELSRLLPGLKPPVQVALIGALAQRGDVSAIPALKALAESASPEIWPPLIQAFDESGDDTVVPLLAGWAASGLPEIQRAARQALTDLHRGNVMQAIIEHLANANPAVQAELARALGARGDKTAVPRLVDLAQRGPAASRKGALQALSVLVDDSQLGSLVDLVLQAKEPVVRAETAEALNFACQRIQAQRGHTDVSALVHAAEKAPVEARSALLPVCSGLIDPKIRAVLRNALLDQDPQVHSSAVHALCDTADGDLLPDLLQLMRQSREEPNRSLAIAGTVRLVTQEDSVKLPNQQRVAALKTAMNCAATLEEKRRVLAGLGEIPDADSLPVIRASLDDSTVRNEAARAAVKVASALPGNHALDCVETLKKALVVANDEGTRRAVQLALQLMREDSDYLTSWQVAGPYQQANKDYAALFDISFPPESPDAPEVKWQNLPAGADSKRPWVMDLLKALGGQQCVAYARTWVHADQEQNAVLELGSDDGVKVWLNDKQVYALNIARPLQPNSDKVNVTLHPGWNPLLLKVTQNNQGWEFCVRVRNKDGSPLEGIRCDCSPITTASK